MNKINNYPVIFRRNVLENVAASLDNHLQSVGYWTDGCYKEENIYKIIKNISIANQTAVFITDGIVDKRYDKREFNYVTGTLSIKETYRCIKSLMYNCISNDGIDHVLERCNVILNDMFTVIIEDQDIKTVIGDGMYTRRDIGFFGLITLNYGDYDYSEYPNEKWQHSWRGRW